MSWTFLFADEVKRENIVKNCCCSLVVAHGAQQSLASGSSLEGQTPQWEADALVGWDHHHLSIVLSPQWRFLDYLFV